MIVMDFFDDSKPCPPEIKDCEKLRQEFKTEISKINPRACSACIINGIKSKYINIIQNSNR